MKWKDSQTSYGAKSDSKKTSLKAPLIQISPKNLELTQIKAHHSLYGENLM